MKSTIVIISGLSGSGKTVALRAMEDAGFVCVDNLPPELIDSLASTIVEKGSPARIAVGVDIREKDFLNTVRDVLPALRLKYDLRILFLEAEQDVLLRRFKETRRPHPLMVSGIRDLQDALRVERPLLEPLRDEAEKVIETGALSPHQLRRLIREMFEPQTSPDRSMRVALLSFGFKFGLPQHADLVFDVRFLPNPFFVPELKDLEGTRREVREFVLGKPASGEFIERLCSMLDFLIPQYAAEGKSYLTVAIGCTGGVHRSVVICEEVSRRLSAKSINAELVHREL